MPGGLLVEITIKMTVRPQKRKELLLTFRDMIKTVREQKGCLGCMVCLDMEHRYRLKLIGVWETQESLDDYMNTKLYSAMLGAIRLLCTSYDTNINVIAYRYQQKQN